MASTKQKANKNAISSDNSSSDNTTTLYSRISEIQPLDLLQRLDKEGISTRGDMPGLRARLLRHELRKIYPETNAALHKDLELSGKEAENWCIMMHLWEIDMRARSKMREQQERSCLIVDRKLDETSVTKKPFENDVTEKNRVDYLLSCMKLLKSWELEYPGLKGQTAKDFLENLNDFRKFADIGDQALLLMLPSVLKNGVKAWYRSQAFASWEQFETAFIQHAIVSNQPRAAPSSLMNTFSTKVPPQRTLHSNVIPQFSTHSLLSDIRPNIEPRMTQSFAYGIPDNSIHREQFKLQKDAQEQPQAPLPTSSLTTIRSNPEDQKRRIMRERELHRARYLEYLQQSRINCTKERLPPYLNAVQSKSIEKREESMRATIDKCIETKESHMECVKKLRLCNLKYSGKKGQVVIEFIEDLNDFRKYANVSDDVLLDVLSCVLSGSAKSWFRRPSLFMRKRWSNWEEFKEEFLKRFYDSTAAKRSLKNVISSLDQLSDVNTVA